MAMLHDSYNNLKQQALEKYDKVQDRRVIVYLKEHYKNIISSQRRFEQITNLRGLIEILEKRNELNALDIKVLDYVYDVLQLRRELLTNHQKIIRSLLNLNSNVAETYYVMVTVSSQINYSWKSLARYLKVIQEPQIDAIEDDPNLTNNESRAMVMLEEYQRRIDPADMKVKLLKALKLADRMDIHDQVQKLFLQNI